jgi:predicted ester cyclase
MSSEENAALFPRYFTEVLGEGKMGLIDDLFAEGCVVRGPHIRQPPHGTAELRQAVIGFRRAFPRMEIAIDDVVAGEDHVVVRWTHRGFHDGGPLFGMPPTGKPADFAVSVVGIFRLVGGKAVDYWDQPDLLGLLRQVGALPAPT